MAISTVNAQNAAWFNQLSAPAYAREVAGVSGVSQERVLERIERFVASSFTLARSPEPRFFTLDPQTPADMVRGNFSSAVSGQGAKRLFFDAPDIVASGLNMVTVFERGWLWRKEYFGIAMEHTEAGQIAPALVVYFVLHKR